MQSRQAFLPHWLTGCNSSETSDDQKETGNHGGGHNSNGTHSALMHAQCLVGTQVVHRYRIRPSVPMIWTPPVNWRERKRLVTWF